MLIAKIISWAFGVIYVALGLVFSIRLKQIGQRLGTTFGREGLVDALAVYGGLHLATGTFIIICSVYGSYDIGLLLGLLMSIGLSCIRIIGMFIHDRLTTAQFVLLAPEVAGIILGAVALWMSPHAVFGATV